MLIAWAKKKDTPYVLDPVFQGNFLADLKSALPERFAGISLADIDLSELNAIATERRRPTFRRRRKRPDRRNARRQREALKAQYGTATVDDIPAEVGAYLVEPPGIFMGRGAHPLRGRWKRRIDASDVTLNLDEGAPVPPGNWKKIVHERDSVWLASWYDALSQKAKYVWLADSSHLRQQQDQAKYLKAAKLEADLASVRQFIRQGMEDDSDRTRKVATVCHLIDRLAMRVGDEKDEDEADTVGASTLRVEHVQIGAEEIAFDFLGKDSIRWQKTIAITGPTIPCRPTFASSYTGKKPEDLLFDGIDSTRVNRFLGQALPGLTAKVFRTYHATTAVRDSLAGTASLSRIRPSTRRPTWPNGPICKRPSPAITSARPPRPGSRAWPTKSRPWPSWKPPRPPAKRPERKGPGAIAGAHPEGPRAIGAGQGHPRL